MLVKWGSIIVKGSGKLGGHVFSSGPSGASVHTLAKARNPQTRDQMAIRSRFTQLTQNWSDLTETQRESWYDAESTFSRVNRFGDVISLSGKNLYESINAQRLLISLPIIDLAPLPAEIPFNFLRVAVINLSLVDLRVFGTFEIGKSYVIVATQGLSQGTRYVSGRLRIIRVIESATSADQLGFAPFNYDSYVDKFGVPIAGTKIVVGTYSINESGQKSIISSRIATINP